jgi:hypothetical protein
MDLEKTNFTTMQGWNRLMANFSKITVHSEEIGRDYLTGAIQHFIHPFFSEL